MGTYEPLDASKLTREEKRDALESLLFITEKRDGRVKSRKCAIGSKQRTYDGYDKCAGSSPTVTTKGLIMTCAIDAHEERDNAIVDVGHAFLHADNDENILMKLCGVCGNSATRVRGLAIMSAQRIDLVAVPSPLGSRLVSD